MSDTLAGLGDMQGLAQQQTSCKTVIKYFIGFYGIHLKVCQPLGHVIVSKKILAKSVQPHHTTKSCSMTQIQVQIVATGSSLFIITMHPLFLQILMVIGISKLTKINIKCLFKACTSISVTMLATQPYKRCAKSREAM